MNVSLVPPLSGTPDPGSCTATSPTDAPPAGDVFAALLAALTPSATVPTCVSTPTGDESSTGTDIAKDSSGESGTTPAGTAALSSCSFGAPGTIPTTTASSAISTGLGTVTPGTPQGAFDGVDLYACPADASTVGDAFDVRGGANAPKVAGPTGPADALAPPASGIVTPPIAHRSVDGTATSPYLAAEPDETTDATSAGPVSATVTPIARQPEPQPVLDVLQPIDEVPRTAEASPADSIDLTAPEAPAVDDAPAPTMPDASIDAATITTSNSAPRTVSTTGDVAPTSIGRLVAATVPQLRGTSDEVRMSVRLDPPSLGHVTVDISSRDGAVHVVVRPTEATTTDLLAAQRSAVSAALSDAGFQLGGFDVRSNDRRDAPKARATANVALDDATEPESPTIDDGALRL